MAEYTHVLDCDLGEISIEGDVEFNDDGEASFDPEATFPAMTVKQLGAFNDLLQHCQAIYTVFGGITKIKIEEKE